MRLVSISECCKDKEYVLSDTLAKQWRFFDKYEEGSLVELPFEAFEIEAFVKYSEGERPGDADDLEEILDHVTDDESWLLEVEGGRATYYSRLGDYLRLNDKFVHIHDWVGLTSLPRSPKRDKVARAIPYMSVLTGIFYSIHKYGPHHWSSVAWWVPAGMLTCPNSVYELLLSYVESTSPTTLSPLEAGRRAKIEVALHLRLWHELKVLLAQAKDKDLLETLREESPHVTNTRSRTADLAAEIYVDDATYLNTINMAFRCGTALVHVTDAVYTIRYEKSLTSNAPQAHLNQALIHIMKELTWYNLPSSCFAHLLEDDFKNVDDAFNQLPVTVYDVAKAAVRECLTGKSWASFCRRAGGETLRALLRDWLRYNTVNAEQYERVQRALDALAAKPALPVRSDSPVEKQPSIATSSRV